MIGRRWWLGPVFASETLRASRRWTHYLGRAVFVLLLLAGMGLIWESAGGGTRSLREMATVGTAFFSTLVGLQLVVILLAAPAATAGAICVDKGRGTLVHAFVTDLTGGEIVRGKMAARFLPLVGLVACGLPVLALGGLLGGVEPLAALGSYLVIIATALVVCAVALAASVWAKKPHQALLVTYALLFFWVVVPLFLVAGVMPLGAILIGRQSPMVWAVMASNPFSLALLPSLAPSEPAMFYQGLYGVVAILVAAAFLALASGRLRPVVLAQSSRPMRRRRPGLAAKLVGLLPEPPLDANPVLWREWHRKRPSLWAGRMWSAYTALSLLVSAGVIALFYLSPTQAIADVAARVNAVQVSIGLLLLGISAAMALAEERDRGSLDVVLTTPLPTAAILRGKWLGTFAMVPRLAILPIWIAAALAMVSGQFGPVLLLLALILAYSAALTSLGLLLATWIPRLGRAIGATVAAYALVLVGGPLAMAALRHWLSWRGRMSAPFGYPTRSSPLSGLAMVGPFDGVGGLTAWAGSVLQHYGYRGGSFLEPLDGPVWPLFWIAAYAAVALALFGLALLTFDPCMGRVRERREPAGRPPAARARPPVPVEVIA